MYTFAIPFRFKPYVRMTQRGKWVKPGAQAYLASKQAIGCVLRREMIAHGWSILPGQTPLWVQIQVSPAHHNRDIDNEAKAILDAMSGVVFPDDRWVDVLTAARGDNGGENTVVKVGVLHQAAQQNDRGGTG